MTGPANNSYLKNVGIASSKRMFIITVTDDHGLVQGKWAQKTGGEFTADATKVWDGGRKQPSTLAGPPQAGNVTLTRPFHRVRDGVMCKQLRLQVGSLTATINIQATDPDLNAVGEPLVYHNALLVGLTEPEVDAGSGDAGTVVTEWAVGQWQ